LDVFFIFDDLIFMAKIKEGQLAIDFVLPDQNGKLHRLSDYKGKWILLYFYPKDDTPGCTKEACTIRDFFPNFKKLKRNTKQHENKNTPNNTKYNFRVFSCVLKILVLFSWTGKIINRLGYIFYIFLIIASLM
jgi:hypothetical protein